MKQDKILKTAASIAFIIAVIFISIIVFCNRDMVVYNDKYGYLGVLILCFICNATVFAPSPSIVVAVTAAQTLNPVLVIICAALGTTAGELVGYFSGRAGRDVIDKESSLLNWIRKRGIVAVFIFALIPFPLFDVVGVFSGYSRMKLVAFIVACMMGKLIKMFIYVYGSLAVTNYVV